MTPERKAKWLADLRSGHYPKTKSYLKNAQGYCCLGLLLETEPGCGFVPDPKAADPTDYFEPNPLDGMTMNDGQELSGYAADHFGLSDDVLNALMHLNDTNESFDPVCVYIETKL